MSNEWITDRRPTEDDADDHGYVWITEKDGKVWHTMWDCVAERPWMHFTRPEPYVKPKVWTAIWEERDGLWTLHNTMYNQDELGIVWLQYLSDEDAHREAAERIAAIYEEVMP